MQEPQGPFQVAGLLLLWLGSLQEPLLSNELQVQLLFIEGASDRNSTIHVSRLQQALSEAPGSTQTVLRPLLMFLQQYCFRQQDYEHELSQLAEVFSPMIFSKTHCLGSTYSTRCRRITSLLISQALAIFTPPEVPDLQLQKDQAASLAATPDSMDTDEGLEDDSLSVTEEAAEPWQGDSIFCSAFSGMVAASVAGALFSDLDDSEETDDEELALLPETSDMSLGSEDDAHHYLAPAGAEGEDEHEVVCIVTASSLDSKGVAALSDLSSQLFLPCLARSASMPAGLASPLLHVAPLTPALPAEVPDQLNLDGKFDAGERWRLIGQDCQRQLSLLASRQRSASAYALSHVPPSLHSPPVMV